VDIRGGSVGVIGNYEWNHAICLAGGSLYGLEAATGVSAELFAMRGYANTFMEIALVSGAIIYDYGPRDNAIYPDKRLGRAALRAAARSAQPGVFPIGRRGAGCSATVGKGFDFGRGEAAGQGAAFRQLGETKIAAFTVVNALGAIINRERKVVRGLLDPNTGTRRHAFQGIEQKLDNSEKSPPPQGNTTLTVVVTNQKLGARSLNQFARQLHSSMARNPALSHHLRWGCSLRCLDE
jgi:L-aminopeptidase/D-esterase-like protein